MNRRNAKNVIFEYTAIIGKALSSPKRLELLDILCQAEKTVDVLAKQAGLDIKLTSAHLKVLKSARLVESRRQGRFIYYRAAGDSVLAFWAGLRNLGQDCFLEIQQVLKDYFENAHEMSQLDRKELLKRAKSGDVVVIDVRPEEEYSFGHLPHAQSIPFSQLKKRLSTLDPKKEIVAYCRGPYCVLSHEAVEVLRKHGFQASRISDGVSDWVAAGLPIKRRA